MSTYYSPCSKLNTDRVWTICHNCNNILYATSFIVKHNTEIYFVKHRVQKVRVNVNQISSIWDRILMEDGVELAWSLTQSSKWPTVQCRWPGHPNVCQLHHFFFSDMTPDKGVLPCRQYVATAHNHWPSSRMSVSWLYISLKPPQPGGMWAATL